MGAFDAIRDFNDRLRAMQSDRYAEGYQVAHSKDTAYAEPTESKARKNYLTARSGNNIRFTDDSELSENYKNALNDAIKFYQTEFKITPNANVRSDISDLGFSTQGITMLDDNDKTGQRDVNLRYLGTKDEENAMLSAKEDEANKWSVKNSGNIANVPVHEFGHVLADMLFPYDKKSGRNKDLQRLYVDALKDVGVSTKNNKDLNEQALDKLEEMSGYATSTGLYYRPAPYKYSDVGIADEHEVVAEALADYYYNRDKASDISKAVVKRLKNNGATYGLKRAGGVDTSRSSENFFKNLRRYNVVQ